MNTPLLIALGLASLAAVCAPAAAQAPIEKVSVRAVANFDFDKAALRAADRQALLAEVANMKDVTWQTVITVGHTDNVGPAEHNGRLAERRSASVRDYLVGKGLDPSMIKVGAKAANDPVADNGTAAGRAMNRRTEVEFQGVRAAR